MRSRWRTEARVRDGGVRYSIRSAPLLVERPHPRQVDCSTGSLLPWRQAGSARSCPTQASGASVCSALALPPPPPAAALMKSGCSAHRHEGTPSPHVVPSEVEGAGEGRVLDATQALPLSTLIQKLKALALLEQLVRMCAIITLDRHILTQPSRHRRYYKSCICDLH